MVGTLRSPLETEGGAPPAYFDLVIGTLKHSRLIK
jgi:hypothetical protein